MDTPDKSDPTQLKRVAFIAAASAISATSAKPKDAQTFAALSAGDGRRRIAAKYESSINLMQIAEAADLYTTYKKAAITIEQSYEHEIADLKTVLLIAEDDKNAISSMMSIDMHTLPGNWQILLTVKNHTRDSTCRYCGRRWSDAGKIGRILLRS